eukprot:jgi/Bigna1/78912/fgenesh1_pg.58_\
MLLFVIVVAIWSPPPSTAFSVSSNPTNEKLDPLWLNYVPLENKAAAKRYACFLSKIVLPASDSGIDRDKNAPILIDTTIDTIREFANISLGIEIEVVDMLPQDDCGLEITYGGNLDHEEGFSINVRNERVIRLAATRPVGFLYGVFELISRMQQQLPIQSCAESPDVDLRIWQLWDDLDGHIERGYSGGSLIWPVAIERYDRTFDRLAKYLASIGLNALSLNNVNACSDKNIELLEAETLKRISQNLAPSFARYGVSLYFSICYAAPSLVGPAAQRIANASLDPANPAVERWWRAKAREIHALMPHNFGGFLVKADSENHIGPGTFNRTEDVGANMLATALEPFGGRVLWRAFVYNLNGLKDRDRAVQAYLTFKPLDGKFKDNVIVQIKNGPIDFQVREPVSPLFGGLRQTNVMIELQAAQEYTGQQIHMVGLSKMWRSYLDFDTHASGENSTVAALLKREVPGFANTVSGMAAVSNLGNYSNWTGHIMAASNWYGLGKLAWDTRRSSRSIHREWARRVFPRVRPGSVELVAGMLESSWETYEKYDSPLGLGFVVGDGFGGGPCDPNNVWHGDSARKEGGGGRGRKGLGRTDDHYWPDPKQDTGYSNATHGGVGCNRNSRGTGFSMQYHEAPARMYDDIETCPENLLLFFHHVPYEHRLKSTGESVLDYIIRVHREGVADVARLIATWRVVMEDSGLSRARGASILARLENQLLDAAAYSDIITEYFISIANKSIVDEFV